MPLDIYMLFGSSNCLETISHSTACAILSIPGFKPSPRTVTTKAISRIELGIAAFFAVAALCVLIFLIISSLSFFGTVSDLPEYYVPARLILEGRGVEVYNLQSIAAAENQIFPSLNGRFIALYIPPPGLTILSPVGLVPVTIVGGIWKFIIALSLVASVVVISRLVRLQTKPICYLIAAVCLSQASFELLRIDQLAGFLLLSFSLAIAAISKERWNSAGLALVVFLLLKPQHALPFLAFLFGSRRYKPFIALVGGVTILTAVSLFQLGPDGFMNYFNLLSDPASTGMQQPELTPTLRGQLLRLFPDFSRPIFLATSFTYLLVLGVALLLGRIARHRPDWLWLGVVSVMPLALVFSVHCHMYDFLLLVPSLVLLFNDSAFESPPWFKLVIMFGGMLFMVPLSVILHYDYLLKGGMVNPWFVEMLLFCAVLALFVRRSLSVRPSESIAEAPDL